MAHVNQNKTKKFPDMPKNNYVYDSEKLSRKLGNSNEDESVITFGDVYKYGGVNEKPEFRSVAPNLPTEIENKKGIFLRLGTPNDPRNVIVRREEDGKTKYLLSIDPTNPTHMVDFNNIEKISNEIEKALKNRLDTEYNKVSTYVKRNGNSDILRYLDKKPLILSTQKTLYDLNGERNNPSLFRPIISVFNERINMPCETPKWFKMSFNSPNATMAKKLDFVEWNINEFSDKFWRKINKRDKTGETIPNSYHYELNLKCVLDLHIWKVKNAGTSTFKYSASVSMPNIWIMDVGKVEMNMGGVGFREKKKDEFKMFTNPEEVNEDRWRDHPQDSWKTDSPRKTTSWKMDGPSKTKSNAYNTPGISDYPYINEINQVDVEEEGEEEEEGGEVPISGRKRNRPESLNSEEGHNNTNKKRKLDI